MSTFVCFASILVTRRAYTRSRLYLPVCLEKSVVFV